MSLLSTMVSNLISKTFTLYVHFISEITDLAGSTLSKMRCNNSHSLHLEILVFIPCHRNYSQSEYRKAVSYPTVLHPTFLSSCAARMSHWLCWSLYVICHGIFHLSFAFSWYKHSSKGACVYRENSSDSWDIKRKWVIIDKLYLHVVRHYFAFTKNIRSRLALVRRKTDFRSRAHL